MSFIMNVALHTFVAIINPMKNILILTDFSKNSWNSIKYTVSLFQNKSCNFHLLHAAASNLEEEFESIEDLKLRMAVDNSVQNFIKEFDKLTKKNSASPLNETHAFTTFFDNNDVITATKNYLSNNDIDLIVIGTNGLSSKVETSISSISEAVITKVKCSTLVVPKEAKFNGLNEIAFPTDFTNFYEAKLLASIQFLSNFTNAFMRFLFLAKKSEKLDKEQEWNKETLQDYFKDRPHSFHAKINTSLELSVEKFITKNNIDLIIMAAKNLNLFEQILFRPNNNNISYYSKTPFLILHQSN